MMRDHGLILHTQRFSTEDGPGIRTSVFFKGCPLRCDWCHNPESISRQPQVHWLEFRCIGCNTCLDACPSDCLSRTADGVQINRVHCDGCGVCDCEQDQSDTNLVFSKRHGKLHAHRHVLRPSGDGGFVGGECKEVAGQGGCSVGRRAVTAGGHG